MEIVALVANRGKKYMVLLGMAKRECLFRGNSKQEGKNVPI